MKLASPKKKTPACPPRLLSNAHLVPNLDGEQPTNQPVFLNALRKAAGLTAKDFQYEMRVSKTTVDNWFAGTKHDPVERTKDICAMFRRQRRHDLVATILVYVAGGYEFEGAILTAQQTEALRVLSKAVPE